MLQTLRDAAFILFQRLLPARLLARVLYAATRSRNMAFKNLLIRGFVQLYAVDTGEAEAPVPDGYASFNDFFTRRLRPGARPLDSDPAALLSPADGVIQQIGYLQGDTVLQVKGLDFSASELLGGAAAAAPFRDGAFATIYLAPWNYHRVHAPLAGQVHRMLHVPGELWSVNATTAARVPRLFSRNERLVCQCLGAAGPFAVVLVGALNVGSMSTAWAGEVLPPAGAPGFAIDYAADAAPTRLARGGELGQFNMGSTVIILLPAGAVRWAEALAAGTPVRVGQSLGRLANPASS